LGELVVLETLERLSKPIKRVRNESDARDVLRLMAEEFGYPGGFLCELDATLLGATELIDTDLGRQAAWWETLRTHGFFAGVNTVRQMLEADRVVRLSPTRFDPDHPYKPFALKWGIGHGVGVPITQATDVAGYVALYGDGTLERSDELTLQLLSYQLFTQVRLARSRHRSQQTSAAALPPLTPREKDVMRLSAVGLTSLEIADRLGLSPRTVNQHVDNVADKLGTRNRTHTIAELVRNDMLD